MKGLVDGLRGEGASRLGGLAGGDATVSHGCMCCTLYTMYVHLYIP